MAQTPNLLITEVAANQNQKEVTVNTALVELEAALTDILVVSMPDADYTLTTGEGNQALGNLVFQFNGTITADRNVIVPVNKKLYLVQNNTSASLGFALTFKTPSGSGINLLPDSTKFYFLYCDGTDVVAAGPLPGAGSGSVTNNEGSLVSGQVVLGNSGADVETLGSYGSTGQVLTSNGPAVPPSWQAGGGGGGGGGSWDASTAKRQAVVNLANMVWVAGLTATATPENESLGTDVTLMGAVFATWRAPDATHGGGVTISDGSNGADYLGGVRSYTPSYVSWAMGQNLQMWGSLYLDGGTTNVRLWFGLSGNLSGSTPTQYGGSDLPGADLSATWIGFRYSTVAGDTNYKCICSDGSNDTVVDSGVAADTNSHRFAFVVNDAVPNVKFYIDGNLVATITTHLPASGTNLGYIAGSSYHTSAGSRINIGSFIIQSDF